MKLETIKKDKKKKIIIGSMIVLSVVGCLTLTTSRAKYRNVQSLKLASGTVKINYYDFKIVAMKQSEDGENYTDINTMPESGYTINEEKSYCTTDNKIQVKGKLKTNSVGEHVFSKLNKNDKCYIWFDKIKTGSDMIIANIKKSGASYKGETKPDFTSVATGAETEANNGIYMTDDPIYGENAKTYYWRGAATTNHVIFDNKCWRIVRINGDKSIRLIYNGVVQVGNICQGNGQNADSITIPYSTYNSLKNNNSYVGWTYTVGKQRPSSDNPQTSGNSSSIKTALETWYNSNISDKDKISVGKFCNDKNTKNNETWVQNGSTTRYYASPQRLFEGIKAPTLSCSNGDIYELKVGTITADEVQFAGASGSTTNKSYYLYNGQFYWTMTPHWWYGGSEYASVIIVCNYGQLSNNGLDSTTPVRAIINLRSDVTFNLGSNGTQNNPYIVQ